MLITTVSGLVHIDSGLVFSLHFSCVCYKVIWIVYVVCILVVLLGGDMDCICDTDGD